MYNCTLEYMRCHIFENNVSSIVEKQNYSKAMVPPPFLGSGTVAPATMYTALHVKCTLLDCICVPPSGSEGGTVAFYYIILIHYKTSYFKTSKIHTDFVL